MPRRFSVIVPLEFHRGQIEPSLRQWTRGQTYPRDRYEVIAAACRHSLSADARLTLSSLITVPDRLLLYDAPHDMALSACAAREAVGDVLVFTESHCLPDPTFLARADESLLDHPEWAGFSGRSLRITHNALSIVEADVYEEDIRHGMEEHPWRKILDQCFVVRKTAYDDAGGFRAALGHFAEWHLAAGMHYRGDCIGYAPLVRIWHYYAGDCREIVDFARDFARGEMTYHATFVDDECRTYFDEPIEWSRRHHWMPAFTRTAVPLAWQARPRTVPASLRPGEVTRRIRLLAEWVLRASFGAAPDVLLAFGRFQMALWALRLGLRLGAGSTTLRAGLLRLVDACVRLERVRFVRTWLHTASHVPALPAVAFRSPAWRPECSNVFRSAGIHPLEVWQGRRFRWSEPVGMVDVGLAPGDYRFTLEWLPVKPIENLRVYVDGRHVEIVRVGCQATGGFTVDTQGSVRFSWTCEPWKPQGDSRLLGLPVVAIDWTPSPTTELGSRQQRVPAAV
jgi:hypothetical protein